jgi:transcription elongation factor GreA
MDAEFKNTVRAIAQGEETAASIGDPRWGEIEALAKRLVTRAEAEAALKSLETEPASRKRWPLLLLVGLLEQGLGEEDDSLAAFEVLGDKLIASGNREGVLAILPRFLEPEPVGAAVRLLHFLARTAESDAERIERLRGALEIRPRDPELHHELAQTLERTGESGGATEHRLQSIELRLVAGHVEGVADGLLRAIEEDLEREPARVGTMLLRFSGLAPWGEAEPLLELALPAIEARAQGRLAWTDLESAAGNAPATSPARALLARYLRVVVGSEPDPEGMVSGSGILNPSEPISSIGARLARIRTLPPGSYASHATWGFGRVTANDGETVTLEFPGRAAHKMSLAMATRSLDRAPSDGLRVLRELHAERLRALIQARDPEVVFAALRDLGGTATVPQMKPHLERALGGEEWSRWWNDTKEGLKGDPRIDTSEAYRQIYRLAVEGAAAAETVLPGLNARAAKEGLALIRKFVREHPDEEARLHAQAASLVARWARDGDLETSQRAQALCFAGSWAALAPDAARDVLTELIARGLMPDDLPLAQNQEQLLDLAAGSPREEEFLWRAVQSRLPRLRDRGLARLRSLQGAEFPRSVALRLQRPTETPELSVRLIDVFVGRIEEADAPDTGLLVMAAVRLLEGELSDGSTEALIGMLGEGGALRAAAVARGLVEEREEAIERTVLHWRGSERRLVPILEFLRAIGRSAISEAYEERRNARTRSLLEGKSFEDLETRHILMSRATCQRLEAELTRLRLDLKTTIPAAIESARQLGDLRENAEYEAAKLKQANVATRVQELMTLLTGTRILETMDIDATRAGAGTEVELVPAGAEADQPIRFWILGEGDGALGSDVVSYRAPIVRPLLGKPVGAEVQIEMPGGERAYRIASIRRRLYGDGPVASAGVGPGS